MSSESPGHSAGRLVETSAATLRVAPLGEIRVYHVTEEELERLEEGSPGSLWLNFGLTFLGVFLSFLVALLTTTAADRVFLVFVIVAVGSGIASSILLAAWWRSHKRVGKLIDKIRNRMPPRPAAAEAGFVVDHEP